MSTGICRRTLAGEPCQDTECRLLHTAAVCETCHMVFGSTAEYKSHITGQKHSNNASGKTGFVYCPLCDTHIGGHGWQSHLHGSRHKKEAKKQGVSPEIQPERPNTDIPGHTLCVTCNRHILNQHWKKHPQTRGHIAKSRFAKYQAAIDEAESDKNSVTISGTFDFDIVELTEATQGVTAKVSIQTTSSSQILLVEYSLASSKGRQVFSPFVLTIDAPHRTLTSSRSISFTLKARQDHIGRSNDRLDFVFEDVNLKKRFIISRFLHITVGSKADHDLLKPKAPYKPRARAARQPETEVVEGIAPPPLNAIPYKSKLLKADMPTSLSNILSTGTMTEIMRHIRGVYLPQTFNLNTYGPYFKCLLWVEEFQMESDLGRYDIDNAQLTSRKSYYYLDVPGLAEKRPSVLMGDSIHAQKSGAEDGRWFEGRVHIVHKEEVGLRFHGSFRGGQTCRIRFKLNRIPTRRQHQAMGKASTQERLLFPKSVHLKQNVAPNSLSFYNPVLGTNPAQKLAVSCILSQAPCSIPFVVFGPPGTGKTVTIVEAILQLLRQKSSTRILACAPSNSAADLIASRLATTLSSTSLLRVYAPSRSKEQVPVELKNYICQNSNGHFSIPDKLSEFRVVVTTCISAAIISGVGIPRGHFSHIFIDEAGQATEPEAMVSIKMLANDVTNVILSGDPKQLGPIIRSSIARQFGLEKSYIERLMELDLYDEKKGRGRCVVKLVKNFRSHKAILKFPNDRFYGGELEACGDPNVINTYLKSTHLRVGQQKFPIVFYAIAGKDDREASSPSFFNIDEVTQVKTVVEKLRNDKKIKTGDDEIGVIAPYRAQCMKIRQALKQIAGGVKVGSVEEFQGQERKVIVISTVRSSQDFVEYDLRHTLGFVASPRRFNVAVTRAKALLVVVGNPAVLSLDPLWRSFLNYIYNNGGWTGPPPSWDPNQDVDEAGGYDQQVREAAANDMNEFTRTMESLTLASMEDGADVDTPWNEDME